VNTQSGRQHFAQPGLTELVVQILINVNELRRNDQQNERSQYEGEFEARPETAVVDLVVA
jgi:hypothetical protein